jgi:carbamoylphosphate synthase small subunit
VQQPKHLNMITNFEEVTVDLNDKEMEFLPLFIQGFSKHDKSNPIKSDDIVKSLNLFLIKNNIKYNVTGVKVRKFSNYIRSKGLIPLIATSEGYYVSNDKDEIEKQIKSLTERANSILKTAQGLRGYLNQNT